MTSEAAVRRGPHQPPSPSQPATMTRRYRGDQEVTPVPVAQRCAPRPCPQAPTLPCREHDSELWFAERPDDVERAKALCGDCPLRAQCLQGALSRREPWGVWGGELLVQGTVVARKRPRGRPRKHPVAA